MTIVLRVLLAPVDEKPARLLELVTSRQAEPDRYQVDLESFRDLPNSPFAYWLRRDIRRLFRTLTPLASRGRSALSGGKTLDDFRWIRAHWETALGNSSWVGYAKGGAFAPYYSDVHLVLDWRNDASALKAYLVAYRSSRGWSPNWTAELHGSEHYLRPGLTWPRRTDGLSFRVLPPGCVFGDKGPAAFVRGDDPTELLALAAIMNSSIFGYLVAAQLARTELARSYEVGIIQKTPVPDLGGERGTRLATLARSAWLLRWRLDSVNETSHAFLLPSDLAVQALDLDPSAIDNELREIQSEIDRIAFELYGINTADQPDIISFGRADNSARSRDEEQPDEDEAGEDEDDASPRYPSGSLLSWLVGVAFGRFDSRLATGDRVIPSIPDPYDPLSARSPGMWPADEQPPARPPDVLVGDPGHSRDIAALVSIDAEVVGLAVLELDELRRWLDREFFSLHIRMYSKSRRKAPIYWQLATRSASYSVWLYIHAFSADTMFRVQNEYVMPKLRLEERRLEQLLIEADEGATATQRKVIADQETFVEELRDLFGEVRRVAPLWNPDLDDGVLINFAPLWRLVPHHRSWQRELKATWDALCGGKYDWAHLAMHLWPERVVPKCVTDRSLAITHDLEDVFWEEDRNGKWHPRKRPTRDIDDLIRVRASSAVKAALHDLINAPTPTGQGGGRRRATNAGRGGR